MIEKEKFEALISLINCTDKGESDVGLNQSTDWSWLPEVALKNNISPLIYYHLKENGLLTILPVEVSNKLMLQTKNSTMRDLKLRAVYKEIGLKLKEEGINFIALKGIYLQQYLYDKTILRPMLDIDILIPEQDLNAARKTLLQMGGKEIFADQNQFINSLRHHQNPIIFKGISIELHRNLFDFFDNNVTIGQDQILAETKQYSFDGFSGLVLKDELLLIHLCHHAFTHLQGGVIKLIFFSDINNLIEIRNQFIDWKKVIQLSGTFDSVSTSLQLTKYIFKTSNIPQEFLIQKNNFIDYENLLISAVFNKKADITRQHYLAKFAHIKGKKDKVKYIIGRLFPNKKYIAHKYKAQHPFYLTICYILEMFSFIWLFWAIVFRYLFKIANKKGEE